MSRWRRWRWLVLLPVAVVLVLAASASRLQIFWLPGELRDVRTGSLGDPVRVVDRWEDEDGVEQERRFTVTLVGVRPARWVQGYSGPERVEPQQGVAAWQVMLDFEVDPDVPMGGCLVSVLDEDGREARALGGLVGETLLPSTMCEPTNRRGPGYDGSRDEDYLPRLPTYRVAVYAVTSADMVPDRVRIWWEPTDAVELTLRR